MGQKFAFEGKQQRMLAQARHLKLTVQKVGASSQFQVDRSDRRHEVAI